MKTYERNEKQLIHEYLGVHQLPIYSTINLTCQFYKEQLEKLLNRLRPSPKMDPSAKKNF